MDDLEAAIQNDDPKNEALGAEVKVKENREVISVQPGVAQHENIE
jgi:hypothetical protein